MSLEYDSCIPAAQASKITGRDQWKVTWNWFVSYSHANLVELCAVF